MVVLRGNRVEEFDFESAQRKQLRGNIYLAKVTRVEPSLQAAFVDYGGNRHGFLAFSEIHPDYYQIPVADRQALIDEEERAQRAADDEVDRRSRRHRHQRHASRRTPRRAVMRERSCRIPGRRFCRRRTICSACRRRRDAAPSVAAEAQDEPAGQSGASSTSRHGNFGIAEPKSRSRRTRSPTQVKRANTMTPSRNRRKRSGCRTRRHRACRCRRNGKPGGRRDRRNGRHRSARARAERR